MSEKTKYESYLKKLEGLCEEHELNYRLRLQDYPISLTVTPLQGLYEQMSMLERDENVLSPDAYLRFEVKDGEITHRTGGTFVISDALFTKLRALFRNLEYRYLQFFFRDIVENTRLSADRMPDITEDDEAFDEDAGPDEEPDWEEQIRLAAAIVRAENQAGVGLLSERLAIGLEEAAELLNELADRGVISDTGEVLPADAPEETAEADEDP